LHINRKLYLAYGMVLYLVTLTDPRRRRAGLSVSAELLAKHRHRRLFLFGHIARLDHGVPAHDTLRLTVDTCDGRNPMATWRRLSGRPRNVWINNIQEDANALLQSTLYSPYNFWTYRAIRFEFGRDIQDGHLRRVNHKRPLSGRGLGHATQFRNFGTRAPYNVWMNRAIRLKFGTGRTPPACGQ